MTISRIEIMAFENSNDSAQAIGCAVRINAIRGLSLPLKVDAPTHDARPRRPGDGASPTGSTWPARKLRP